MTYDAIIFDSDGVLVRPTATEQVEVSVRRAFEAFGVPDPAPAHLEAFVHGAPVERLESIAVSYGIDVGAFWTHRESLTSNVQRELVESGEKSGYADVDMIDGLAETHRLGVVSSNQQATVSYVLEHTGLASHFDVVYGRAPSLDGYRRTKPEPYYLDRAIDELEAARPLYVGDSDSDIEASNRVDIDVAYVRRGHNGDPTCKPTYVIASLRDLPAIVTGGSP